MRDCRAATARATIRIDPRSAGSRASRATCVSGFARLEPNGTPKALRVGSRVKRAIHVSSIVAYLKIRCASRFNTA